MKKYKKMLKKIKKFIKKEYGIDNIDIRVDDFLITVAERIVMKAENCNIEQAYKMWLADPKLHLPGWVTVAIASEFCTDINEISQNNTIGDLIDKAN